MYPLDMGADRKRAIWGQVKTQVLRLATLMAMMVDLVVLGALVVLEWEVRVVLIPLLVLEIPEVLEVVEALEVEQVVEALEVNNP